MKRVHLGVVSWIDDRLNHRRGTSDESDRAMPSGAAWCGPRVRWRWLCDYNDRLMSREQAGPANVLAARRSLHVLSTELRHRGHGDLVRPSRAAREHHHHNRHRELAVDNAQLAKKRTPQAGPPIKADRWEGLASALAGASARCGVRSSVKLLGLTPTCCARPGHAGDHCDPYVMRDTGSGAAPVMWDDRFTEMNPV